MSKNAIKEDPSKRIITIAVSLVLMFCFKYLPAFPRLSTSGMQVLGIFIGTLILWLTISIDWPSVLAIGVLALVPELKFSSILSGAFGGSTFVFLMLTFVVTYALGKTTYIKRIAVGFITSSIAKKGPWHFAVLYFASIIVIGMFISPTVLFFVYLPIVEEIYSLLNLEKGNKLAAMLMMGTVIMTGISSGMTPIAHVFPILAMSAYESVYGTAISYAGYLGMAIPVGILTTILVVLVFRFILRPDMKPLEKFDPSLISGVEGHVKKEEKIVLWVFILVVALWILPSLVTPIIKTGFINAFFTKVNSFGTAMPPLIGAVLLCIITVNGKPLLNFGDAMSKGVSWPSLIMCASTTAIGSALTNSDIGITSWLSDLIAPSLANLPVITMVLIFVFWAAVQTNLSSNMVTATVVSATALTVTAAVPNVNVAGLIILIGMMAAYAFATPPAMPSVAIAASSGWTNTMEMMKYGFIAMTVAVLIASFVGYPLACILL